MTLEAASAVLMAALFLGESVRAVQVIGGVGVLGAAAVIARGQPIRPTALDGVPG
jgi:drug/metabolite transporter (DMT)-like permease